MYYSSAFLIFLLILKGFSATPEKGNRTKGWIRSRKITKWGEWGPAQKCPPHHYVNSMIMRYEGKLLFGDDTAMSGVQLFCTPFLSNYPTFEEPPLESWRDDLKIKPHQYITSAVGEFGEWMEWITCPDGLAVGFQLRSEPYQGSGDDTATNDMTIRCIDTRGEEFLTESGEGGSAGIWTEEKICPRGHAICGIQTQVEAYQKDGDDTALNNVNLRCCKLPLETWKCEPSTYYKTIFKKQFPPSTSVSYLHIEHKIGISLDPKPTDPISQSIVEAVAFSKNFGDREKLVGKLKDKFTSLDNKSNRSDSSFLWKDAAPELFLVEEEKYHIYKLEILCSRLKVEQLIGACGSFVVKTNKFRHYADCPPETFSG